MPSRRLLNQSVDTAESWQCQAEFQDDRDVTAIAACTNMSPVQQPKIPRLRSAVISSGHPRSCLAVGANCFVSRALPIVLDAVPTEKLVLVGFVDVAPQITVTPLTDGSGSASSFLLTLRGLAQSRAALHL